MRTNADTKLEDVIEMIESVTFYLERKSFRKLVHDNYDEGYILNFTPLDKT